jgi:hypothetical protein
MFLTIQIDQHFHKKECHPFQSIHSIIDPLITSFEPSHFSFRHNHQSYSNFQLSCDALNIQNEDIIEIIPHLQGGDLKGFLKFAGHNLFYVIIALIIALIPVFTLATGLISVIASILKVVFDESFEKIGLYLSTNLGKYSLYHRLKLIFSFFKYIIFILIAYVSITFPLFIFTCMLKGESILENPRSLCSPANASFITGMILTTLYMLIYGYYRGFGNFMDWIKSIFRKNQTTDMMVSPVAESAKKIHDTFKYASVSRNPSVGFYYVFLDKTADFAMAFVNSFIDIGCKGGDFSPTSFMNKFKSQIEKMNSSEKKNGTIQVEVPQSTESNCCNPKNYFHMGKMLYDIINNTKYISYLQHNEFYSSCILIAITFLEKSYTVEGTNKESVKDLLCKLESRLQMYAESNQQTYVPSNYGLRNQFLKVFFFYSICNIFTFAQNSNLAIEEMGSIYNVVDILKAGSATGYYVAILYVICLVALFICGIFGIY